MAKKYISPSLLNIEFGKRHLSAHELINLGIEWIHYDYMDGAFVPNKAIQIHEIEQINSFAPKHIKDIHLMCFNPGEVIKKAIGLVDYATIHYEVFENDQAIIDLIHKYHSKIKFGLSIKPNTPIEKIYPLLKHLDLVLIMSVEPGAGGQKFIMNSLDKIQKIKEKISQQKRNIFVQVDGGINNETAPLCWKAGADVLVSGSYLVLEPTKNKIDLLLKEEK